MTRFEGKVVLVTGSRGIGKAISKYLSDEGARMAKLSLPSN